MLVIEALDKYLNESQDYLTYEGEYSSKLFM